MLIRKEIKGNLANYKISLDTRDNIINLFTLNNVLEKDNIIPAYSYRFIGDFSKSYKQRVIDFVNNYEKNGNIQEFNRWDGDIRNESIK